ANVGFFYPCFERGEINLAHGAFVDDRVNVVAVKFGVVTHEVLDGGAHSLALHSFDIAHRDTGSEVWIFAEIFKVAAIQRRAINVHSRPQHEVHAPGASVAADLSPNALGQCSIPGSRQRDSARHGCSGTIIAYPEWSIRHFEAR